LDGRFRIPLGTSGIRYPSLFAYTAEKPRVPVLD